MSLSGTKVDGSPAAAAADDELATLLSRALKLNAGIESIARQPSPFVTLFPAEVLTLTLSDGRQLRVFLKHLGPEQANQPDKERRDREARVYQDLLRDGGDLPVTRYFASRHNARTSRQELYLEYVDDWSLQYHDLEHWFTAARRLADLHAHFALRASELRGCGFLLKLDEAYFDAWAGRAHEAMAEQSDELADRLENLRRGYAPACDLLASQPVTLVHNDLACKNVLADRATRPARICIIDWELAGIGCGLLDLVHLKYGLAGLHDAKMLETYCAQARSSHLLPASARQLRRVVAACELHKTLYRLAHSPAWRLPPARLTQWVAEAETFLRRVLEA